MTSEQVCLQVDRKTYKSRGTRVSVLEAFTLKVFGGEAVAIVGESGVGKTSLLNILGLVDRKFVGTYTLFGVDTARLSDREMARWRNEKIGFVLQESALINSLSVWENIMLPALYAGRARRRSVSMKLLKRSGSSNYSRRSLWSVLAARRRGQSSLGRSS